MEAQDELEVLDILIDTLRKELDRRPEDKHQIKKHLKSLRWHRHGLKAELADEGIAYKHKREDD